MCRVDKSHSKELISHCDIPLHDYIYGMFTMSYIPLDNVIIAVFCLFQRILKDFAINDVCSVARSLKCTFQASEELYARRFDRFVD